MQWAWVWFPGRNLSSVLSFKPAKYTCLPIRYRQLDLVHNTQHATYHLGIRKGYIHSLEPSWIAV
eukprot:15366589-Ditylum_brightwellii.AAC.1